MAINPRPGDSSPLGDYSLIFCFPQMEPRYREALIDEAILKRGLTCSLQLRACGESAGMCSMRSRLTTTITKIAKAGSLPSGHQALQLREPVQNDMESRPRLIGERLDHEEPSAVA